MNEKPRFSDTLSMVISIVIWYVAGIAYELSCDIVIWLHDVVWQGNVSVSISVITVTLTCAFLFYAGVLLVTLSQTRLFHRKSLFECMQHQMGHYFGFYMLMPLVIATLCWDVLGPLVEIKNPDAVPVIPLPDILCKLVTIISENTFNTMVAIVMMSIMAYALNLFENFPKYLNIIFGSLSVLYLYYILGITTIDFELGKWLLLFIALCYVLQVAAIIICKATKKEEFHPACTTFFVPWEEFLPDDDEDEEEDEEKFDFHAALEEISKEKDNNE